MTQTKILKAIESDALHHQNKGQITQVMKMGLRDIRNTFDLGVTTIQSRLTDTTLNILAIVSMVAGK